VAVECCCATVEGHIYRAMAKTGTSRREELAALLRRPKSRNMDWPRVRAADAADNFEYAGT
jgi:hypothetical protein